MQYFPFIFLAVLVLLLLLFGRRKKTSRTRHKRYIAKAEKVHRLMKEGDLVPGQVLSYLRKTNPYVFEELVLLGFEENGYRVVRNRRYSGDGGIDGKVTKDGTTYLVQCKRYSRYIDPAHVEDFSRICREANAPGFFVHTGKTGKGSREQARTSGNVKIISGMNLLNFLNYCKYNNS